MKTEDLKAQGFTDEQIKFIMAENGKDIEAEKQKLTAQKAELDGIKKSLMKPISKSNHLRAWI